MSGRASTLRHARKEKNLPQKAQISPDFPDGLPEAYTGRLNRL
jgi:hypothetical protein